MWTFAGKTATSSAINPQAARLSACGMSSKAPNPASPAPLTHTSSKGAGRYGGMIRR